MVFLQFCGTGQILTVASVFRISPGNRRTFIENFVSTNPILAMGQVWILG